MQIGQIVRMHPKLATLESGDYSIATGKPSLERNAIYFNTDMQSLANKLVRVTEFNSEYANVVAVRDKDSNRHWWVIHDWILPTQTFKEL